MASRKIRFTEFRNGTRALRNLTCPQPAVSADYASRRVSGETAIRGRVQFGIVVLWRERWEVETAVREQLPAT